MFAIGGGTGSSYSSDPSITARMVECYDSNGDPCEGSNNPTPVNNEDTNLELENFLNSDVWDQTKPYDDWNKLTQCEKDFFIRFPSFLESAQRNRAMAEKAAKNNFDACTLHNGLGDAFRHAYFSALNAQNMGYKGAKMLGDCHETEVPTNLQNEVDMDLNNNSWGYDYVTLNGVVEINLFLQAFLDAYNNGKIIVIKRSC